MKKKINKLLEEIKKLNKKEIAIIVALLLVFVTVLFVPKLLNKISNLPEVRLREMQNKGMLAIMVPDDKGGYKAYTGIEASDTHIAQDKNSFPKGYALNLTKSYCIDKNGQAVANAISRGKIGVNIKTNKEVYCTLYYDYPSADLLIYNNIIKIPPNCTGDQCQEISYTNCTNVQCALDELYTVLH